MILENIINDMGFIHIFDNKWNLPDNNDPDDYNISIHCKGNCFYLILYHSGASFGGETYLYKSLSDENILDATVKIMNFFHL